MKDKIITITFSLFLSAMLLINIIKPPKDISHSERRKLAQLPKITTKTILSGKFMDDFEKYALDQIAFRDDFRGIKALCEFDLLGKLDNNDIYIIDDNLFKMEYPFKIHNVYKAIEHMNTLYELYLKDMDVYYSIIPDKNFFVARQNGYLSIDYRELEKTMKENIENMTYISLFNSLTLDDYYRTDVHWRQERLDRVVDTIAKAMNFTENMEGIKYISKKYYPFYGAYYGQSALRIKPDTLVYKSNSAIENAIVNNYADPDSSFAVLKVYNEDRLGMVDSYDVFLSGATPFIEVINPGNTSGRELIIFRDSFASSLAPLLLENYSKITLIDLRYMNHNLLEDLITFKDQDVLFLYNALLLNNGNILK